MPQTLTGTANLQPNRTRHMSPCWSNWRCVSNCFTCLADCQTCICNSNYLAACILYKWRLLRKQIPGGRDMWCSSDRIQHRPCQEKPMFWHVQAIGSNAHALHDNSASDLEQMLLLFFQGRGIGCLATHPGSAATAIYLKMGKKKIEAKYWCLWVGKKCPCHTQCCRTCICTWTSFMQVAWHW